MTKSAKAKAAAKARALKKSQAIDNSNLTDIANVLQAEKLYAEAAADVLTNPEDTAEWLAPTSKEPLLPDPAPQPAPTRVKRQRTGPVKRFAEGLGVNWEVVYKGEEDKVIPYHSLRDMVYHFKMRGMPISKVETVRAFIKRRRLGVKAKQFTFKPFADVVSITRLGSTMGNVLAGRVDGGTDDDEPKAPHGDDVGADEETGDEEDGEVGV